MTLPGLRPKGDVRDWLSAGHTVGELLELVDAAPLFGESEPDGEALKQSRFHLLTVDELLAAPAPRWTVHELIPECGIGAIYGATGSGKTFAGLDLACAIVRGADWRGWAVAAGSAIYIATEGRLALRLGAYIEHHGLPAHALDRLRILESRINLLNGDAAELVEAIKVADLPDLRLVIVDTLNRAYLAATRTGAKTWGLWWTQRVRLARPHPVPASTSITAGRMTASGRAGIRD